jgi:alkane 1-monooxygenase
MIPSETAAKFQSALPFWISFLLIPAIWLAAFAGGWWVLIIPVLTWYLFTALDLVSGLNLENVDLDTGEDQLT